MVVSVTHSKAVICWEEPYYGEVLGYTVSYHLKNSPDPKLVNVTTDFLLENCQDLLGLYDDSEYAVQVYGWNERETGQLSTPVEFRTSENCKYTCINLNQLVYVIFLSCLYLNWSDFFSQLSVKV